MTTIGIILLLIGVFVIVAGWVSVPRNGRTIGSGALVLFGGMFIGIGGNPSRDMPNGSPAMVGLGIIMVLIGIALIVHRIIQSSSNAKKNLTTLKDQQKIAFYKACVDSGIRECVGEKAIQKASLIAKQRNLPFTDISALFTESKTLFERSEQIKLDNELETQRNNETQQHTAMIRFASYTGRDKRIAMLQAERAEALASAKNASAGTSALIGATQQKELDWATHGGIASGIAGPAAGIATAMNIQAKNAEIRAQNAANLKAFAPVIMSSMNSESAARARAENLQKKITEAETKLVAEESAKSCLDRLAFSDTAVDVTETGTCFVKTKAALKKSFCIFDDVDAVVDGTVIARIFDEKREIGCAKLVLPTYGVSAHPTALRGCCLFCGKPGMKYTVSFEADNLWAMEK